MYFNRALIIGFLTLSIISFQCIGSAIYFHDSAQVLSLKRISKQHSTPGARYINERWIPWFGRPIDKLV